MKKNNIENPKMILGIPGYAFKLILIFSLVFSFLVYNLWGLMLFPILYIFIYWVTFEDPNALTRERICSELSNRKKSFKS